MGNYYAGIMNSEAGRELRHHGILGQKWGIRRFQNPDGSLTPAGRERYGYSNITDKDRKQIAKMIAERPRNVEKIKNHPIIANAAYELRDKATPLAEAKYKHERLEEEVFHHIYDNDEVYEKWLDKAVDYYMDKYSDDPGGTREEIKNWYRYDDGDQNDHGVFETYIRESGEPLAKKYKTSEKNYADLTAELRKEADKKADAILGEDADGTNKFWVSYFIQDAVSKYGPMQPSKEWDNVPKTGMPKTSGYFVSEKEKQQFLKENYGYNQNNPTGKWADSIAVDNYISRNGKLPDWDSIDNALSEIDDESIRLQRRREKSDKYISKIVNDSYKMDDNGSWNSKNMPKNWTKIIDKIVEASNDKSGNTKAYNDRIDAYNAYKKAINPVKKRQLYEKYLTALSKERSTEGMGQILFTEAVQKEINKLPKEQRAQAQYYVAATYYD